MKFKNQIFLIVGIVFVVSCRVAPEVLTESQQERPPQVDPFSTLPRPLADYVNVLEGIVLDKVADKSLVTDARRYRARGIGGPTHSRIGINSITGTIPAFGERFTNDYVEDLYLKQDNDNLTLVKLYAMTLNGSYIDFAGVPKEKNGQFGVFAAFAYNDLTLVEENPEIYISNDANSDLLNSSGFALYRVGGRRRGPATADTRLEDDNLEITADRPGWGAFANMSPYLLLKISDSQVIWYDVVMADSRYYLNNNPQFVRNFNAIAD